MQSSKKRKNNYPVSIDTIDGRSYKVLSRVKEMIHVDVRDELNQKRSITKKISKHRHLVNGAD